MTIDPYSPCPGGTGKKIKFCCSELVHELDKLQRMIDGDQRVAALDYVTKLDAKYPGRACLLSTRATLEAMLGNREQSAATLAAFREKHPENPIALAELAVLQATGERPTDAILTLERALALSTETIPDALYEAFGTVAARLAEAQHVPPAQNLLWFQASLSRGQDQEVVQHWAALEADPSIPIFLKLRKELEPTPSGAPWKYEFELALERAHAGQWHAAAEKFAALIPIAGKSPALWQNLARLRASIADYAGAAEAMRRCAMLDVPVDDAVEAEATALVLELQHRTVLGAESPPSPGDLVKLIFAIANQTALDERFAADRHLDRIPVDPQQWRKVNEDLSDDEPPPRFCYALLDRSIPTATEVQREDVPLILGTMFLFGRQTDRPERMEMILHRSDLPAARELLSRIAGDALGETQEEVVHHDPLTGFGEPWQFRFPDDMPTQRRLELQWEETKRRILEVWPDTPLVELGGKTPRQSAPDPNLRNRVLAFVLLMQSMRPPDRDGQTLRELRERLQLPLPAQIDPQTVKLDELPRVRLDRLQAEKLDDDELLRCYRRAKIPRQPQAAALFARQIVTRPSLAGRPEVPEAYEVLLGITADVAAALELVEQGRAAAQRAKQSTASWDLTELRLRLERGEGEVVKRLLQHLEREHINEPGVAQAIFELLYELGLIDQYGRRIAPAAPETSPIIVPGAAEPGRILVPGGEAAAAQSSKPVIWTPGME